MTEPKTGNPTGVRTGFAFVKSQERLCLRPPRLPGVAPPCEMDNVQLPGAYHSTRRPITLPRLAFLEKDHGKA